MNIRLHTASVGVLRRFLDRLLALLDRAEAHCDADTQARAGLLEARLNPDMLPFRVQVEIATNFALRAAFLAAGEAVPDDAEFAADFDGMRARIARACALLDALPSDGFDSDDARMVRDRAGEAELALPVEEFLFEYALPNFFFHLSIAYALLRQQGVPVGKADFDGYHRYRGD